MAQDFVINDSELTRYISELAGVKKSASAKASRWVRNFTNFTEKKMKSFAKSKSSRSTGKLASSISSKFNLTSDFVEGVVFVPEDIKYQFAIEYGIKQRRVIRGRPKMTFPAENWKKARRSVTAVPHRGYFVFTQVLRGKYKGRHFTQRSFERLLQYYESKKNKVLDDIGRSILFAR